EAALGHDLARSREAVFAHVLYAAADRDVADAGGDQRRRKVDRLLGRAALAVDGGRRDLLRQAGLEPGVAADVERLLAPLLDAAGDHVADLERVDSRAVDQLLVGLGEEVGGMQVLVVTLLEMAAADRRADRLHDHDFPAPQRAVSVLHCLDSFPFTGRSAGPHRYKRY